MFSTADFIRYGCRDNPFIRYLGFHVSMICGDWLHVMDLAAVADACGSESYMHTMQPVCVLRIG